MITFATLRQATRNDVLRALDQAPFAGWPQDEDEVLGVFNLMLELLLIDVRDEDCRKIALIPPRRTDNDGPDVIT